MLPQLIYLQILSSVILVYPCNIIIALRYVLSATRCFNALDLLFKINIPIIRCVSIDGSLGNCISLIS